MLLLRPRTGRDVALLSSPLVCRGPFVTGAIRSVFACAVRRCLHRLITYAEKLGPGNSMGRVQAETFSLYKARQPSPPPASKTSSAQAMLVQLDGACPDNPPACRMIGQGDLVGCDAGGDDGSAS